jgi:hypothetical protein
MGEITDLVTSWFLGKPREQREIEATLNHAYKTSWTPSNEEDKISLLTFSVHSDRSWAETLLIKGLRDSNGEVARHAMNMLLGWAVSHRGSSARLSNALDAYVGRFPDEIEAVNALRLNLTQE